ncbi:shikimate kinase [Porphyromonas pogonae]|uniref:shikimate kinase n=1 Tax=Porphyromonas pogonae TaxID=867595 RepID=UPI002E79EF1C|nr:shikimate kinase [Porphyromonas pogonae]
MKPIFIIGYMGSGKSTLGKKLAESMSLPFIDTDIFMENRFRQRISDMFASIGETKFRKREAVIIQELSGMQDCIIATGGGLPCHSGNMELMNESGVTIYLDVDNETLAKRLELCKRTRPTIKDKSGDELMDHVVKAMQTRLPIYKQARLSLPCNKMETPEDEDILVKEIEKMLSVYNSTEEPKL